MDPHKEEVGSHLRISLSPNGYFRLRNPACFGIRQGSFVLSLPFHCRTSPTGCKEGFQRSSDPWPVSRGPWSEARATGRRPRVRSTPIMLLTQSEKPPLHDRFGRARLVLAVAAVAPPGRMPAYPVCRSAPVSVEQRTPRRPDEAGTAARYKGGTPSPRGKEIPAPILVSAKHTGIVKRL